MLFIYICLVGFVISLFIWKKKNRILDVCVLFILLYFNTYICNSKHRAPYVIHGAIMLLVALGISAYLKFYISKKQYKMIITKIVFRV